MDQLTTSPVALLQDQTAGSKDGSIGIKQMGKAVDQAVDQEVDQAVTNREMRA
jgi:hypothetical protein